MDLNEVYDELAIVMRCGHNFIRMKALEQKYDVDFHDIFSLWMVFGEPDLDDQDAMKELEINVEMMSH